MMNGKGMMTGSEEKKSGGPKKGRFEVEVLDKGFSMTAMHYAEGKKGDIYPMTDMKRGVASSTEEVRQCFEKFMSGKDPFGKA